jgi:ethanolamine ammonia-lyase large subunit
MTRLDRKAFLKQAGLLGSALVVTPSLFSMRIQEQHLSGIAIKDIMTGEDVFAYINRVNKSFDVKIYREILGAANAFKEGDEIAGLSAKDETSRGLARQLLSHTKIGDIQKHDVYNDEQYKWIRASIKHNSALDEWTLGDLKTFILSSDELAIKNILPALESDVISMLVKLMSNQELIQASSKIFNPLPDSKIGSKGYMSARVQPNSPTDDPEDIIWQVFDAWSYAVGDLLLGCNPVSSEVPSVLAIEKALLDLRTVFNLEAHMTHSVLAHIDVQAEAEKLEKGTTGVWFQSIAGTDSANTTFDLSIDKLKQHLKGRKGKFGLYAETGQGADGTNGHSEGFDMVMHESRKYGLIRCLKFSTFL